MRERALQEADEVPLRGCGARDRQLQVGSDYAAALRAMTRGMRTRGPTRNSIDFTLR